ncbi:hypothetical protein CDCA_CDCA07G2095 [Cyanidium caldarium]|uniref:NAD-dependent epimerase/dehydratase domain-containing protein n=1 Tax=Cyanidium caldarium TaxID=2771 RepID=A0AAV9IVE7_CYACA|nr:hypothetical protein CDCA_CDCA07G2095 [Cyanidium caldarium]
MPAHSGITSFYRHLATQMRPATVPLLNPRLVAHGTGGRSSVSGVVATVFGSTGFLGRYVVNRLGRMGSTVFVAWRGDELDYRHLKPMGDLGQINPVEVEARNMHSLQRAVAGSNVVINLIGKWFDTRYYTLEDVHVNVAESIARAAAAENVPHLIHVSALGVHNTSPHALANRWLQSKRRGEEAVRRAFPAATIMRPADVFGPEDRFLTRIADMLQHWPFYPLIKQGAARVQPVWVDDVARAITASVRDPELTAGRTYELAGPSTLTRRQVVEFVIDATKRENHLVSVPTAAARLAAKVFGRRLPFVNPSPRYTPCDVLREAVDVVMQAPAAQTVTRAPEVLGFAHLDVRPYELTTQVGHNTLRQYRRGGDRSALFHVD